MRIFFSGARSGTQVPEVLISDLRPSVMPTFYPIFEGDAPTLRRMEAHFKNRLPNYRMAPTKKEKKPKAPVEDVPSAIGSMFLDSGGFSLYNLHARIKGNQSAYESAELKDKRYAFFRSKDFYAYLDAYATWINEHKAAVDFYANVDAIFNPELSYKALKYLEKEHGLKPVPVIHYSTPLKWVEKHLEEGYPFIGFGGTGQKIRAGEYIKWADQVFNLVCDQPSRLPLCRTHGFAMTSWRLLKRYPWWSVDSTSWLKYAAYGWICVPHMRGGVFVFDKAPYVVRVSMEANLAKAPAKHILSYAGAEKRTIQAWLEFLGIPLGENKKDKTKEVITDGVINNWEFRAKVNLRFYQYFQDSLPPYPWAFSTSVRKGLLF